MKINSKIGVRVGGGGDTKFCYRKTNRQKDKRTYSLVEKLCFICVYQSFVQRAQRQLFMRFSGWKTTLFSSATDPPARKRTKIYTFWIVIEYDLIYVPKNQLTLVNFHTVDVHNTEQYFCKTKNTKWCKYVIPTFIYKCILFVFCCQQIAHVFLDRDWLHQNSLSHLVETINVQGEHKAESKV